MKGIFTCETTDCHLTQKSLILIERSDVAVIVDVEGSLKCNTVGLMYYNILSSVSTHRRPLRISFFEAMSNLK